MYLPVLFVHLKKVFESIVAGIEPPGYFIGYTESAGPVKTIVGK